MKVGEYVRVLKEAGVHGITEETVRKNVAEMLKVLSREDLLKLINNAIVEENDWLAKAVTIELLKRKKMVWVMR